jgi:hypothetical protein
MKKIKTKFKKLSKKEYWDYIESLAVDHISSLSPKELEEYLNIKPTKINEVKE